MSLAIDRTALLRGDLKGRHNPVRPPWSIPEQAFRSTCNSCGDCLDKCPENIIEFGRSRLPQINFDKGECLFCGECLQSCASGALVKTELPWRIKANIDQSDCLAFKGVECRSCGDPCESRAINWINLVGQSARPVLDVTLCNGCGACYSVCPVSAIQIKIPETESKQ